VRPPHPQGRILGPRSVGLVMLTALLLLAAGCGGGASESATGASGTAPPSESATSSTGAQTAGTEPASSSPATSSAVGDASTACRYWTAGSAPNKKSVLPASFPKFPARSFVTFCNGRTSPQTRDEYAGIATTSGDPAGDSTGFVQAVATIYQAQLRTSGCAEGWGSKRRGIYIYPDRVSIRFECGGQRGQFVGPRNKPVFWIAVV
jgi:hypothetical protein